MRIERKYPSNILNLFGILHSDYYVPIEKYHATTDTQYSYESFVQNLLPKERELSPLNGIWSWAKVKDEVLPQHGFKIHISGYYANAKDILAITIPILIDHQISFKFCRDEFCLNLLNDFNIPRANASKFIVIYPRNDEIFKNLIEILYHQLINLTGPKVFSDKKYRDSKIVFYRYGSFLPKYHLNDYGEKIPVMEFPSSTDRTEITIDKRHYNFTLPPDVEDPFNQNNRGIIFDKSSVLLNKKYKIDQVLSISAKGGVFLMLSR